LAEWRLFHFSASRLEILSHIHINFHQLFLSKLFVQVCTGLYVVILLACWSAGLQGHPRLGSGQCDNEKQVRMERGFLVRRVHEKY
jgi:hypothetical protein